MLKNNKSCFIITPIGSEKSDSRRTADGVIDAVIIPVLKEMDFKDIKAAHHLDIPGSINNQVISRIISDDLVIANLTDLNPNVMYELAIRHASQKPVVHICEEGTQLPFDIKDQRTLFYKNDMKGVSELSLKLKPVIKEALSREYWEDSPLFIALKDKLFIDSTKNVTAKEIDNHILVKLNLIESKLNAITYSKQADTSASNGIRSFRYYPLLVNDIKEISLDDIQKKIIMFLDDIKISYSQVFFDKRLNLPDTGSPWRFYIRTPNRLTNFPDILSELKYRYHDDFEICDYQEIIKLIRYEQALEDIIL